MKQGEPNLCSHPLAALYRYRYTVTCSECDRTVQVPRGLSNRMTAAKRRRWLLPYDQDTLLLVRDYLVRDHVGKEGKVKA